MKPLEVNGNIPEMDTEWAEERETDHCSILFFHFSGVNDTAEKPTIAFGMKIPATAFKHQLVVQ